MKRLDLSRIPPAVAVEEAFRVICGGGIVIFPTDSVYGIGCDPCRVAAVERIYALKVRPRGRPLALHVGSLAECCEYLEDDERALRVARALLPGALTLVVRRPRFMDASVGDAETLGLRVPAHPFCTVLLDRCGPLAATSANISGSAAYAGESSVASLPAADLFLDGGPTPLREHSTVLDLTCAPPRLLRQGAMSAECVRLVLPDLLAVDATPVSIGGLD